MQDLCEWVAVSKILGTKSSKLTYELASTQELMKSIEISFSELTLQLNELALRDDVTQLDIDALQSHIRILSKALYLKRKRIFFLSIDNCIKGLKNSNNVNKCSRSAACKQILQMMESDSIYAITPQEQIKTFKLKRAAERASIL